MSDTLKPHPYEQVTALSSVEDALRELAYRMMDADPPAEDGAR